MPRGPKGNGQTRHVSSTNSPRAGPLLVTSMRRRDHARRVFLAVSWVTDLGCHRVKKGSADVATTGTAWPLGRRSPVWAEQQLHRDLGRASYALRDVGQGGRQGHPDGSLRAHQAGEEATKGTVQVPDLGPGKGTYGSSSLYVGNQNRRIFLRSAKPVAARVLSGSTSQQIRRQHGLLVK